MYFSLVVPFFNEEASINKVVGDMVSMLNGSAIDYELIMVNNGSKDKTPEMLEELASKNPQRLKVVHVPVNQGYGWGIINGFNAATGTYVGHMAGDGQIKATAIPKLMEQADSGNYGLIKIFRTVRNERPIRIILSFAFNLLFRLSFNIKSMDINGSPKIFRHESLDLFKLKSKDWFLDAEIMIKAKNLKLELKEVGVEFLQRERGESHVKWNTITEFLKNMYDYKFGKGIKEWKREALKS
jgi:dolichol-phosphate mannosyltransferase